MRGIGSTFSRLPKVAAWVAGAALLAGTLAPRAFAQGDETAMAVPRLAPFDAEGVALPQPLAKPDAALLRRLFADMRAPIPDLVREARGLDASVALNDQLLGVVLAERYLGPGHHSSAAELSLWLKRYTRLPQAVAIAALLHRLICRRWWLPRRCRKRTRRPMPALSATTGSIGGSGRCYVMESSAPQPG
jgi:hypothetical protein